MAAGIRCADHVTPLYPQKLALISPTGGGRSVGIVCSRTKATEFFFITPSGMTNKSVNLYSLYYFIFLEGEGEKDIQVQGRYHNLSFHTKQERNV